MACFHRYNKKASLAQRPFAFMTSNGMPHSRYSRVELILIPCPCNGSRLAARAASPTLSMNLVLVRGQRACFAWYVNKCEASEGWLIQRWFCRAAVGSE